MSCPVCGASVDLEAVEAWRDPVAGGDYRLLRCSACRVVSADPFKHPGADWYAKASSADSYEGIATFRFDWFLSLGFRPGGRVLDVGCGAGQFLELARAAGYEAAGLDANPEAVKGARERGLDVRLGGLSDLAAEEGAYDVITLFDVLEHLDDPGGAVDIARRLLKPGGGLVVTTPNEDRPLPFGRDDFDNPPMHLTRWTPEALEGFMRVRGLRPERRYYSRLRPWDFSRFLIGRLTGLALDSAKSLLYGRRAGAATLSQLVEEAGRPGGPRGSLLSLIREKHVRQRLVVGFQSALSWLLSPIFLPMTLYYRWRRPAPGVTLCLLSVKDP